MKQRMRNRFRRLAILQVTGLVVSIGVFVWVLLDTDFVAGPVVVAVIIAIQVTALLHTVQSHVDALEDFFAAVSYEDFTRRFVEDDVDVELKDAFNRILEKFQDARAERDVQAGYLDTVIRHVPVPFIAARADGSLSLVNNPARRLTGIPGLSKLDDLAAMDEELPDRPE